MYAIANIVYGISMYPLQEELASDSEKFKTYYEDDDVGYFLDAIMDGDSPYDGFETYYSGSTDYPPSFFGVDTKKGFDECQDLDAESLIQDLTMQPAYVEEYKKLWDALPQKVQEFLEKFVGNKPKMFVMWSSS